MDSLGQDTQVYKADSGLIPVYYDKEAIGNRELDFLPQNE